jgi:hypothetical protein
MSLLDRGRRRGSGRSLLLPGVSPSSSHDDGEREVRPIRRLPMSPIYERGGPFASRMVQSQGPKLLRDKLYDRMVDWGFHSVEELDAWMPEREWVKAMCELTHAGFTFDREGRAFRLRKRRIEEHKPSIVDLLSGVTLPSRVGAEAAPDRAAKPSASPLDPETFSMAGDPEEIPEDERMVLDEGETMVLSALDFVTDTCAILARKGRGKTYLAMLIAEQMSLRGVPFVVLDPTGCWSGLLSNADGSPSDSRLVLLGGENGHYVLSSDAGRPTARWIVAAKPLSFVLDLSLLGSEEQHLFVADFADELYRKNRSAIHVFIDEADIFAPQKLDGSSKHQKRCLGALNNMTRRGRFRGIGDTLISQRPAVVNKDLLSQVGGMFFLQMIAPQDLNAVDSWLHDNIPADAKESCRTNLPVLGMGVAYYLKGGDECIFRRFKVKQRATYDSSYTPRHGEEREAPTLAVLDAEDREFLDQCRLDEPEVVENASPGEVPKIHCPVVVEESKGELKATEQPEQVGLSQDKAGKVEDDERVVTKSEGSEDFGDEPEEDAQVLGFEDDSEEAVK